jgi:hypothetical protein
MIHVQKPPEIFGVPGVVSWSIFTYLRAVKRWLDDHFSSGNLNYG